MGTLQQSVGGLPSPSASLNFKAALVATTPSPSSDPIFLQPPSTPDQPQAGLHKGSPALIFSRAHVTNLSHTFQWSLIGKFSYGYNKINPKLGRPPVEDLHKYFVALDLKGDFQIGLLDNRHLLIKLQRQEDFLRLYSRPVWYVKAHPMRIFKWSSHFHVDRESSIVPVWITLPRLPVHFFEKNALYAIAALIGHPLRMDSATASLKRPSMARVQVELDVLKDRPFKLWLATEGEEGFWQRIDYENVPAYCQHCWHIGHAESVCHVHNPELKPSTSTKVPVSSGVQKVPQQVYVAKVRDATGPSPEDSVGPPSQTDDPSTVVPVDPIPAVVVQDAPAAPLSAPEQGPPAVDVPVLSPLISKEVGFPSQPVAENAASDLDDEVLVLEPTVTVPIAENTAQVDPIPIASATYAKILQGSPAKEISLEERQQIVLSTASTSQNTPAPELIAPSVTPMFENIDGMSSDDDVSQYPFLLPELITDDTVLYRRKLQEVVAKAWSDSTKVLIAKPRAELLAEFGEFHARMRSKAVTDFAQNPVSQDTLPIDDTLTDINVEDGDFADGFITVKPKNRGRGRPRKHKK